MLGVKFNIIDQQMDENLLTRSLLESMRYNLNDHLERVHVQIKNKHVDDHESTAREQGVSSDGSKSLTDLLEQYRNVDQVKLSNNSCAKVHTLVIDRSLKATPCRSYERNYAPAGRDLILRTI